MKGFLPRGRRAKKIGVHQNMKYFRPSTCTQKKNVFIPPFAGRSATRVTGRFLLRGSFLLERMGFCGL